MVRVPADEKKFGRISVVKSFSRDSWLGAVGDGQDSTVDVAETGETGDKAKERLGAGGGESRTEIDITY